MKNIVYMGLLLLLPVAGAAQGAGASVRERVDAIAADVMSSGYISPERCAGIEDEVLSRMFELVSDPELKDDAAGNVRRRASQVIFGIKKNNLENVIKLFKIFERQKFLGSLDLMMPLESHGKDPRVHEIVMKIASDPANDQHHRGNAVNILAAIPDKQAEAVMLDIVSVPYSYKTSYMILHVLREIGTFRSDAARQACVQYIDHEDKYCREAAYASLVKIFASRPEAAYKSVCGESPRVASAAVDGLAAAEEPAVSLKYLKAALKRKCASRNQKKIRSAIAACRANAKKNELLAKFRGNGLKSELDAFAASIDPRIMMRPDEAALEDVLSGFDALKEKFGDDVYLCLLLTPPDMNDRNSWGMMALANIALQHRSPAYSLLKRVISERTFPVDSRRMAVSMLPLSDGLDKTEAVAMVEKLMGSANSGGFPKAELELTLKELRGEKPNRGVGARDAGD